MQRIFIFLFILPLFVNGQIMVDSTNLPNIGDTVIVFEDSGNFSAGLAGANQTWDFSTAAGSIEMLLGFIDASTTPYQSYFPTSNLSVKDGSNFFYLNRSVNGLAMLGVVDSGIPYPWEQVMLPTPLNYEDTLISSDTVYFVFDSAFSTPVPASMIFPNMSTGLIDSLKAKIGSRTYNIVDAWGQVQMPNATYDALRVSKESYEYVDLYFRVTSPNGTSQWIQDVDHPYASLTWIEGYYSWRTNDPTVMFNLVEMERDSMGNTFGDIVYYAGNSLSSIVVSPAIVDVFKIEDISCNGAADGFIMLDVWGTATPLTFSWTGPNSFSANTQDIYSLESGLYTVTVTDANGNVSTDTYFIDEPDPISLNINQSGYTLTAYASGGVPPYQYLWTPAQSGDTLQSYTVTSSGEYTCIITDKMGCTQQIVSPFITVGLADIYHEKKLIRIIDMLGKKSRIENNKTLFYIYDDGTVEKHILID